MITALDSNTALVLIDLQKGIVRMDTVHPIHSILENAATLMAAFRNEKLPIVIVNVIPSGNWQKTRKDFNMPASVVTANPDFANIVDEINTTTEDIFITKNTWNAFYNTALHQELQKRNITGIVLGGVATSIGVEGTARAANELGYNISLATDAMTDRNADAHENSLKNIFPRLGEQGSTAEIIAMLQNRA